MRQQEVSTKVTNLFAVISCEPVPEKAGDHYATIKLTRQQKDLALDENDLWLVAIARSLGTVPISRDSDFQPTAGVTGGSWTVR